MKASKKLVFFGTEDFSAPSLQKLLDSGWPVLAVVTKPDSPSGRGQRTSPPKVKQIVERHKILVLQPQKVAEINTEVSKLKPDLGVLVAYGMIIPQSTIDLFPGGIINAHPSMLPKYRGPSPIEAAILNGDKETGISLMRLTAGMDEGPVYDQKRVELTETENRPQMYKKLAELSSDFLLEKLEAIAEGWLTPKPQVDAEATYTNLLKKEDGVMDFGQPAEVLERQVRAYAGWPKSQAQIFGREVIITKTRVAKDEKDGYLVIKCLPTGRQANPSYLEILELIGPSGKSMSGADFQRGYSHPLPS
ncbi:MAG: methionyl-tRNA formyltransferase [Candidatus Saccharimonadales bacterium]